MLRHYTAVVGCLTGVHLACATVLCSREIWQLLLGGAKNKQQIFAYDTLGLRVLCTVRSYLLLARSEGGRALTMA
jgi:hypothetical protein